MDLEKTIATRSASISGKPWRRITTETFSTILSNGEQLTIPKGYETDLATVPRFLWTLFPPFGRDETAFIVHDYLYDNNLFTRKFADDEMLRMQLEYGATKSRAYIMYWSVRAFAGGYWND